MLTCGLTREKPAQSEKPVFAWAGTCSKWFGSMKREFASRLLLRFQGVFLCSDRSGPGGSGGRAGDIPVCFRSPILFPT